MKTIAFCLSILFAATSLHGAEVPIKTFIEGKLKEYRVPGAVVVVVEGGKTTMIQGFGVTDYTSNRAVDADTRFQLASVTKTFTGALFGKAMDLKEIDYDQPMKEVFPHFRLYDSYATAWATVPDFLCHRSGLPPFEGGLLEMLGYKHEEIIRKAQEIVPAWSFRYHPGYSNVGYFLAGEATARAAGMPWETLVQNRILKPLQMTSTGLASKIMTSSTNVAKPHVKQANGKVVLTTPNYQPVLHPAGALASTGRDMAKYLEMWTNEGRASGKRILSKTSIESLLTPVIAEKLGFAELPPITEESGFDYTAGGWGAYTFQNHRIVEKGGALEGYRTLVVLVPEKKWGVAILSNLNLNVFPEAVRAELLERLLGRSGMDLQKGVYEGSLVIDKLLTPPKPPKDAVPPTVPLTAFVGTYHNDFYGTWKVVQKKGGLGFEAGPAKLDGTLTPWDKNDFLVRWPLVNAGLAIAEFKVSKGRVTGFAFDEKYQFRRK